MHESGEWGAAYHWALGHQRFLQGPWKQHTSLFHLKEPAFDNLINSILVPKDIFCKERTQHTLTNFQVSCYTSAVMSLVKYPPQKKQSMCQLYASTILHHAIKTQPEMLLQSRYHIYWRKLFHAVTSSTNSFFWCHRGSTKKWFMSHPSVVCFPY